MGVGACVFAGRMCMCVLRGVVYPNRKETKTQKGLRETGVDGSEVDLARVYPVSKHGLSPGILSCRPSCGPTADGEKVAANRTCCNSLSKPAYRMRRHTTQASLT